MIQFETRKVRRYIGQGGEIVIQIHADAAKATQIDEFLRKQVDGTLVVSIGKRTKRRTLTANNYLWKLCDEIAKALETDREAIYKALIRRVGVFDYVVVKDQAARRFEANWGAQGIGFFAQEVPSKTPIEGGTQFMVFYGSHIYDREQISRVIKEAEAECRELGIAVMSRQEVKEMIDKWQ